MNETSRMTSIARKINLEFWLRQLAAFLFLDLLLLILIGISFVLWREGTVPDDQTIVNRKIIGESYAQWQYILETQSGKEYGYFLKDLVALVKIPAVVFLIAQLLMLVQDLFHTGKVRKLMKPLNDIAIKTEQLSNMAFDTAKVENFEQAVSSLDPENPDARISTGDQELKSLEIAINNLLERMRESHRQQERFVSDASHELRTPIAVIQGYANLLSRWGKEDEQILEEAIEAIQNESEHMRALIEQLLFLARGDSGRNTLHLEPVDLSEIVREAFEESEMIDDTHNYILQIKEPAKLEGDRAMLKQALRILVQNAAKYSSKGTEIFLRVGITQGQPYYAVQDEGIGMSDLEVTHVFDRFYRADTARSRAEEGTGLGLSIAKWIIDAHKGEIQVLSRPDLGTRFTVKFESEIRK